MTPQDSAETGRPIRALMELEAEPSLRFMDRIRRKIHRRTATSQLATYSWHMPGKVLMEMAEVLGHLIKAFGTGKEQ